MQGFGALGSRPARIRSGRGSCCVGLVPLHQRLVCVAFDTELSAPDWGFVLRLRRWLRNRVGCATVLKCLGPDSAWGSASR